MKPLEKASAADTAMIEVLECIATEDYTTALSCLDKALKIDPKNAKAYFYQANAFAKLENYQEAIKSYQKALEIDPNPKYASAVSRLLVMVARYIEKKEKGDEPEAINIQKKIQKNVDSATKKAENELADVSRLLKEGQDLDNLGKYDEATECYDKALAINPNFALARNNKDDAFRELGKYDTHGQIRYYCMSCGTKHNQSACPKCGSKMRRVAEVTDNISISCYCMSCGTKHNQSACPKCGSKEKRV